MSVQANNEGQSKAISKGKIKWFNEKDGYGFITNADNVDHYFTVRNIIGADLPKNGQTVEFIADQGRKGPIASNITLLDLEKTESKPHSHFKDDRIVCDKCDRKIVPKICYSDGEPSYSICPYCANTIKVFNFWWLEAIFVLGKLAVDLIEKLLVSLGSDTKRNILIGAAIVLIVFIYNM